MKHCIYTACLSIALCATSTTFGMQDKKNVQQISDLKLLAQIAHKSGLRELPDFYALIKLKNLNDLKEIFPDLNQLKNLNDLDTQLQLGQELDSLWKKQNTTQAFSNINYSSK